MRLVWEEVVLLCVVVEKLGSFHLKRSHPQDEVSLGAAEGAMFRISHVRF